MHLETLAQDLVKALQEEGTGRSTLNAGGGVWQVGLGDPHDSRFDVLAKLVGAMRMLDEATSLKGILEGLARGGAGQADRVAVFLLEGQTLRAVRRIRLHRPRRDRPMCRSTATARRRAR